PGGVANTAHVNFSKIRSGAKTLRSKLENMIQLLQESQSAMERLVVAGISKSLAVEFGMVGVAARACGINYDCRKYFT
ncbi:hypothetical protein, partial [Salmonella enterica]|uniref:NADH-quinone oxidoreductase subunit D-related protein n=1 Tax=Salmonella enterica TaxID=28901 RepID=UPI003D7C14BF